MFRLPYLITHLNREVRRLHRYYGNNVPRALAHWAIQQIDPGVDDDGAFAIVQMGGPPPDGGLDGIWKHSRDGRLCIVQIKSSERLLRQSFEEVDEEDDTSVDVDTFGAEAPHELRRVLQLLAGPPPPAPTQRFLEARQLYAAATQDSKRVVFYPVVFGNRGRAFNDEVDAFRNELTADRARYPQHWVEPIDLGRLNELLNEAFETPPGRLQLQTSEWGFGPEEATSGVTTALVNAKTLTKLREEEDIRIYHSNYRYVLGPTAVNEGMWQTLLDPEEAKLFPLYHNGITVLGRGIKAQGDQLQIDGLQVVNGLQTIETLYQFSKEREVGGNIDHVKIFTRFIDLDKFPDAELDHRPLDERIAEYSNRQNPIYARDLRSNDAVQKRLQLEFSSIGMNYRRKRGQYSRGTRYIIDNEDAAQGVLAFWIQLPIDAKNRKKLLFEVPFEDPAHGVSKPGFYPRVFPANVPAAAVAIPTLLGDTIPARRQGVEADLVKFGNMTLLAMFGAVFQSRYRVSYSRALRKRALLDGFLAQLRDGNLNPTVSRIWSDLVRRLKSSYLSELRRREAEALAAERNSPSTRNILVNFPYSRYRGRLLPRTAVTALGRRLPEPSKLEQ